MTAASSQITAISFRGCQILALNSLGIPDASDTNEYKGVRINGAKALTLNIPEQRRIVNTGEDIVLAQFILPPSEGVTGEIRSGGFDLTAEALAGGTTVKSQEERKWLPRPTHQEDFPTVCVLGWREAKSYASGDVGRPHYEYYLVPSGTLVPMGGNAEEGSSEERMYQLTADVVDKFPWGEALVLATDGIDRMQVVDGSGEYPVNMSGFAGNGTATEFTLATSAVNTDKMTVWTYDGTTATDVTEDVGTTLAVGSVTFTAAPASGTYVIVIYEVAA